MAEKTDRIDGELVLERKTRTRRPPMYRVLIHNDNYTTMEFVVAILISVFHLNETDATHVMLAIHNNGVGVVGTYPFEVAETKVTTVMNLARKADYPLLCTMEPDSEGDHGD